MVFPWIQAVFPIQADKYDESDDAQLSDIQFLAVKAFGNKLRSDEGFLSATGDLATLTANTGKDMYLARAQCVFYTNATNTSSLGDQIVLKINGTIIETARFSEVATSSGAGGILSMVYEFKNMGLKVLAGQIIKLEVITLDAQTDVEGFIECFEETTGATPRLPALQISGGTGATVNGDVAFLAKKTFDGKLRTTEGTLSTTGDLATLTANTGKDMYLAEAKVSARAETNNSAGTIIVELKVNGVVKETFSVELNSVIATSGGSGSSVANYSFAVKGLKVAATQIIKLEAVTVDAGIEVNGALVVFEENTGDPPV